MINSILKYIKIIVKSNISIGILFAVIGLAIYHPALLGRFMGDDEGQIVANIYIRSIKNIPLLFTGGTFYSGGLENRLLSEYYRPLMIVWYTLLYALFGLHAYYFHLMQLLLHIINSLLVYKIYRHFLRQKIISLLLTLIFLTHPINSETIAYMGNIQDILFLFFGLSGIYVFLKYKSGVFTIITTKFLFLLSLLSKEIGIVFFLILFTYVDLFKIKMRRLLYFTVSIISVITYILMRCKLASICTLGGSNSVVPIARMHTSERLLQIPAMFFFYVKTLIFPQDLAVFQYWIAPINLSHFYLPLIADILFVLLLVSVPFLIYGFKKSLSNFSQEQWFGQSSYLAKVYAFFLIWFLTGMIAHLNIMPLDSTVAERWFYFPFIGILGISGTILCLFKNKTKIYVILIICILLFSTRSYLRAIDWSDTYLLYSKDIQISKNSASLENNYGSLLFEKGNYKEAERHYRNALKMSPHSAIYWSNLAEIYEKKHDYQQAEKYYLQSIKEGRFYIAFEKYISLLIRQGKKTDAKIFLEKKGLKTFPYNIKLKKMYEQISLL